MLDFSGNPEKERKKKISTDFLIVFFLITYQSFAPRPKIIVERESQSGIDTQGIAKRRPYPYSIVCDRLCSTTPAQTTTTSTSNGSCTHTIIMPAPTALKAPIETAQDAPAADIPLPVTGTEDEELLLDADAMNTLDTTAILAPVAANANTDMEIDEESRPQFAPQRDAPAAHRIESRKVPVPPHRMSPLKASWPKIYPPLVEHLKLQCRMNVKSKCVELRTSRHTAEAGALQKGEDFVRAFCLGFDVEDAIALLRLDDLYVETFEIKDVKTLSGDHRTSILRFSHGWAYQRPWGI
jgi:RNA-binding protein PNO1